MRKYILGILLSIGLIAGANAETASVKVVCKEETTVDAVLHSVATKGIEAATAMLAQQINAGMCVQLGSPALVDVTLVGDPVLQARKTFAKLRIDLPDGRQVWTVGIRAEDTGA